MVDHGHSHLHIADLVFMLDHVCQNLNIADHGALVDHGLVMFRIKVDHPVARIRNMQFMLVDSGPASHLLFFCLIKTQ